jgi:hypothetical protein
MASPSIHLFLIILLISIYSFLISFYDFKIYKNLADISFSIIPTEERDADDSINILFF